MGGAVVGVMVWRLFVGGGLACRCPWLLVLLFVAKYPEMRQKAITGGLM